MRAIRRQGKNFAAVLGLIALAGLVALYILANQRVRFPWEDKTFTVKFAFTTAQAVTPGQGQTVRVSGIRIGDISQVDLKNGVAIVTADIDPQYKGLIHTDAAALLRPKTGLKDMFIELTPGSKRAPVAPGGYTIPVANTLPDVNPDEIFGSLDTDTRDYLKLLVNGAGRGLAGRGDNLREVLARFEPTHRDLARVNALVATRHENLRHLIHALNRLNGALAEKDQGLTTLVSASARVFRAFASEQSSITDAVGQLPDALRTTTAALQKVQAFADQLAPAADALRPAARQLDAANKELLPLGRQIAPVVRDQIRPFVRDARPVVRALKTPSQRLAGATPDLTTTFQALNHLFNLVGYNEKGREAPSVSGRDEGYLFYAAWLQHDGGSLFGTADANGPFRPVTVSAVCPTLSQVAQTIPGLNTAFSPSLLDPSICGS